MAVRSACPLNCPDSCGFLVVNEGKNELRLRGDSQHPVTKGFVCSKGQALAERVFSPDRLRFPLLRQGEGWKRISWADAYTLIADQIRETLQTSGSQGILHHYDYGHNGVLRALDRRFFQALGGVTEPRGSMCWGAGYRAQELDFGAVFSNDWQEIENAKTIILWGRDPALTNIHLMPYLLEAKKRGAKIIVINPIRVKSAEFATDYLRVNPGSDAALALGLAHIILNERWWDQEFIRNYVTGFEDYAKRVKEFPPEKVTELTGVSLKELKELARKIAQARPVSLLLGYGLQRYRHGGNTIRAIDALAAISGNLGWAGAGVSYAHQYHHGQLNSLLLPAESYRSRTFPHPRFAECLNEADPPVRMAFVTRSNPLVQQPNSVLWRTVWHKIPFKVVMDTVMTETARQANLVLPVATIFEEEDLIATSWSPILQYAQKVLEPQGEVKPEAVIFTELSQYLGLEKYFPYTAREWLEYIIEPLREYGISLETLSQGPLRAPYIPQVAWADKQFLTPSGKIELSSFPAGTEAGEAVAQFQRGFAAQDKREFPWHLLTPHPAKGLHSQFQDEEGFTAYIHPGLAAKCNLLPGDQAIVETLAGQLTARVAISEDIHPETVVIPEGTTVNGLGVNQLIHSSLSDFGESTPYYDTYCQIRKWLVD